MRNLIIRDGTSQKRRALPALQEGYFHLDETSFPDLLTMLAEFASLVRFHNAENQPDGDWTPFFHTDETVVMSSILAFNPTGAMARFNAWWRSTPEHTGPGTGNHQHWDYQTLPVAHLATTIDGWYVALLTAQSEHGLAMRMFIESVIVQLRADKSGFLALSAQSGIRLPLAPLWWAGEDVVPDNKQSGQAALTKTMLRTDFHAYLKAIEMIYKEALARLPGSLLSQQHDPSVGMLIAFIGQFQKLKIKLNRFTQNYLNFYYDNMLGSVALPVAPDHTWVVFTKSPALREVLVPAQTGFLAGLDAASRDIIYTCRNDLVVSDARVTALQTVYFDHNRYSAPENQLSDDRATKGAATITTPIAAATAAKTWPTAAWFNSLMTGSVGPARSQPVLFWVRPRAAMCSIRSPMPASVLHWPARYCCSGRACAKST